MTSQKTTLNDTDVLCRLRDHLDLADSDFECLPEFNGPVWWGVRLASGDCVLAADLEQSTPIAGSIYLGSTGLRAVDLVGPAIADEAAEFWATSP
jgi:hypothetical protein